MFYKNYQLGRTSLSKHIANILIPTIPTGREICEPKPPMRSLAAEMKDGWRRGQNSLASHN